MTATVQVVGSVTEPTRGLDATAVDVVEWRADLAGGEPPDALRESPARLLYTLRSRAEGGAWQGDDETRRELLGRAAARGDWVDLEADRDLDPGLLARLPPERRILSWHGEASGLADLKRRFEAMAATPARLYKLVVATGRPAVALAPLELLRDLGRRDVVAFASGGAGAWTRLLAPRLGAPWIFAALAGPAAAPGQPSVERLRRDYGVPALPAVAALFGVVGQPVLHSLSPRLHNLGYRELGLDYLYLPFEVPVFGDFWLDIVERGALAGLGLPVRGLSITAPFKEVALAVAGAASPLAEHLGAANTLVAAGGVWEAESTDPQGVGDALAAHGIDAGGRRAAVIGCGGAGRAAIFALSLAGARVTLVNRGRKRGERVAHELRKEFCALDEFDPGGFDIVVNATPLGRGEGSALPFAPAATGAGAVIVDLAYEADRDTELIRQALAAGRRVIDGREILLHQARPQFRIMTGHDLPLAAAREAAGLGADPRR